MKHFWLTQRRGAQKQAKRKAAHLASVATGGMTVVVAPSPPLPAPGETGVLGAEEEEAPAPRPLGNLRDLGIAGWAEGGPAKRRRLGGLERWGIGSGRALAAAAAAAAAARREGADGDAAARAPLKRGRPRLVPAPPAPPPEPGSVAAAVAAAVAAGRAPPTFKMKRAMRKQIMALKKRGCVSIGWGEGRPGGGQGGCGMWPARRMPALPACSANGCCVLV